MRETPAPVRRSVLIAAIVNVTVGLPVYFWAGLSSYFMNDLPGRHDNLSYLRWGAISAILAAAILILLSVRNPRLTWRDVAFAAGSSAAVNGAWLAYFFGSQISDLGDDSGTMYDPMPTATVRSIAVWCAIAAVTGLLAAVTSRVRRA